MMFYTPRSKYRNKTVVVDGIKFDSIGEAGRYRQLKLLEKAGEITELKLQTKFELQPSFKKNGKTIRAINYKADFDYFDKNGRHIVEDFKGFKTKEFILKQKMFEFKFPELELKIVK